MDLNTELGYQLALQKTLERELITCEMMSERVLIRKEIRKCKQKIKEVLILLEDSPTEQNDWSWEFQTSLRIFKSYWFKTIQRNIG